MSAGSYVLQYPLACHPTENPTFPSAHCTQFGSTVRFPSHVYNSWCFAYVKWEKGGKQEDEWTQSAVFALLLHANRALTVIAVAVNYFWSFINLEGVVLLIYLFLIWLGFCLHWALQSILYGSVLWRKKIFSNDKRKDREGESLVLFTYNLFYGPRFPQTTLCIPKNPMESVTKLLSH